MNSSGVVASPPATFRKASVRETAVLLAVAWLVPFLVHLAPWAGERPLGAHLLPMFWATFVAAYFYGAPLAVVVGLFAPALNLAVTGLPALRFLGLMSAELAIFAVLTALAVRRWPRFVLIAPLSYLVAKALVTGGLLVVGTMDGATVGAVLLRAPVTGLAGLVALAGIDAALVWFFPKTATPTDDDDAAGV
ncbi:MAG: hypothetical protein V4773_21445 [Verrucomicrobiota bacterium]